VSTGYDLPVFGHPMLAVSGAPMSVRHIQHITFVSPVP
jgi:hypothetical protein